MIKELYNYKTAIPLNLVVCELVVDSALRVLLAVSLRMARLKGAFEAAAMFSQRFSPFLNYLHEISFNPKTLP